MPVGASSNSAGVGAPPMALASQKARRSGLPEAVCAFIAGMAGHQAGHAQSTVPPGGWCYQHPIYSLILFDADSTARLLTLGTSRVYTISTATWLLCSHRSLDVCGLAIASWDLSMPCASRRPPPAAHRNTIACCSAAWPSNVHCCSVPHALANRRLATPPSAGIDPVAAPEVSSVLALMVDSIDLLLEDQRTSQRQLCEQQQAAADAALLASLHQYVASEDQKKKATADEAAGLRAKLRQCHEGAAAGSDHGHPSVDAGGPDAPLLLRSTAAQLPASPDDRHQEGPEHRPVHPEHSVDDDGLELAQEPSSSQGSCYRGTRLPMSAEQREDVRMGRMYRELERRERSAEVPAGIEQYADASDTEVRVGAGVGRSALPARQALSRHIPFEHMPTHSAVHAEATGFHDRSDWCERGPAVSDDVFPRFKAAFAGVECAELGPGDVLYIPAGYWHWVFSDGFGVAMNLWTGSPHRRLVHPKKIPAGAADWPAVKQWTPEKVVSLWARSGVTGLQDPIDTKITCSTDPARNHLLPEAVVRHKNNDRSDGLVDLRADQFLRLATAVDAGEPTNLSCMHLSAILPNTPLGQSKDYRFRATADAVSNVSVAGSSHRIPYPGAGPEVHREWGHPTPWHRAAPGKDLGRSFDSTAEAMAHAGVDSLGELMAARDASDHEQPTVNLWMTLGKVQTGLHFDDSYNTLAVVRGRKKILLFPRNLSSWLYPVVARPEPVAEFEDRLADVSDAFDLMLSELPSPGTDRPANPLKQEHANPTEHAFNTVVAMIQQSRGLELVIAMLLSGELMAHHGQLDLARELLVQVKACSHVACGDVPALMERVNTALAALPSVKDE